MDRRTFLGGVAATALTTAHATQAEAAPLSPADSRPRGTGARPRSRTVAAIYRGTFIDTPDDPFAGGGVRALTDGAVLVRDGVIAERGTFESVARRNRNVEVVDARGGIVIPGLVDTHVHYPQVRVVGSLGLPLLDWLDQRALPEEQRLADATYARTIATEFLGSLARAGTTSALVFGAHFASAMEEFFSVAETSGLRVASGLVLSDRRLPEPLLTTPERAVAESVALARTWHGRGRLRYAVTPRFSFSCTEDMLAACAEARDAVPGALFTSHVNENDAEIAQVEADFGRSYVDSYDTHRLLDELSVLAHNVHPTDPELATLASRRTAIAHCPGSNAALSSGSFPLRRHLDAGVRVALGSDIGGGVTFNLLREGLQAAFMQNLMPGGVPLGPAHLLWLATSAGARALSLDGAGDLSVGKEFDAVWLNPASGTTLDIALRHAADDDDAVAKAFALAETGNIADVWVGGRSVLPRG